MVSRSPMILSVILGCSGQFVNILVVGEQNSKTTTDVVVVVVVVNSFPLVYHC